MSESAFQLPSLDLYRWRESLRNGEQIAIRPIVPDDEPALIEFHRSVSDRSVRLRYFSLFKLDTRISHERLAQICMNDHHQGVVLVAERCDAQGAPHIISVGRLSRIPDTNDAEFAVIVSDAFQGNGIGTLMLRHLLEIARIERIGKVVADILNENREMQHICRRLGFKLSTLEMGDSTLAAEYLVPREQ